MDTTASDQTDLAPRTPDAAPAVQSSYAAGFDGMATQPFPEKACKVLAEHVPPEAVEIKPDGIVFVPGVFYRRQLTRAFGAGGWAIVPRGVARVMGDVVIYPGALFCLGRFVAEAVGECTYRQNSQMSYASCLEGAKTDALSRCCKDLGMATELWDAAWRDEWKAEYAEKYMGEKWDGKKQAMVKKELWRLRSGRPVQDIDLMAGAGGVEPKAAEPPKEQVAAKEAAPAAPKATVVPAPPASPPASPSPAVTAELPKAEAASAAKPTTSTDDGVPATPDQKALIATAVRSLKWTRGYFKEWLGKFTEAAGDRVETLDALTAKQAAAVLKAFE